MKHSLSLLNSESDTTASVDLTPLIDIVFVVLIMFILVAPLVEMDQIQLAHATSEKKADRTSFQENNKLKIYVYKDNTIWLNGVPLNLDELKKELSQFHHVNPTISPQIFHDKQAFFGTYQSVKNIAEEVGFESLEIILQPG
ncbi:MAG: biopolymer transporter ExbD [Simkaniaceae bacterium]|nr:biopolymer transporter ExbD [Simkaniaceae bacterium]